MFLVLFIWMVSRSTKNLFYLKPVSKAFFSASSLISLPEIFSFYSEDNTICESKLEALSLLLAKAGSLIEIFIGIIYLACKNSGVYYSFGELALLLTGIIISLLFFQSIPMGTTIIVTTVLSIIHLPTTGLDIIIAANLLVDMPGSALNALSVAFAKEMTKKSKPTQNEEHKDTRRALTQQCALPA